MKITTNSILKLVPLEIRKDKTHFIVEDITSNEFYEMPAICIDAINLINKSENLAEIEQKLKKMYPEEHVNLIDFVEQLLQLQLITEVDGVRIINKEIKRDNLGFLWLSPIVGKFFFNKVSYLWYSVLFILNIVLLFFNSSLLPHYKDLFIFDYMALNIPVWIAITFFTVLIHEFGHILATRAKSLPTKLEVSHRLFLVVLVTDMSLVWKVPSKDRNVLYLAGICFDTVILSIALISQVIFPDFPVIFQGIVKIVVLETLIRFIYQFCVYMKTDFYYVLENVTGCYNLMESAQSLIRKKLPMLHSHKEDEVFTKDKNIVVLYSVFYFIGIMLTVTLYLIFYIPQLLFALKKVLPGFSHGLSSYAFWDAVAFSLQLIIGLALLLYSWRKKYVQR